MEPGEVGVKQVIAMGFYSAKPVVNPKTHWLNMP
jgi:hypothetical protein